MSNPKIDWTAARFVKSSFSGSNQGNCVELATVDAWVGVRDSKAEAEGFVLVFPSTNWRTFLATL